MNEALFRTPQATINVWPCVRVLLPFQKIQTPSPPSHGCVEAIMPGVIVILLTQQQSELSDPSLTQIPPLTGQANPSNLHACLPAHSPSKMQFCHFSQQDILAVWEGG